MNITHAKKITGFATMLLVSGSLLLGGCTNFVQTDSPSAPTIPSGQPASDYKVTYTYNDTDKAQLSANDIVLTVGQKLVLEPAPGVTKNTRFTSSGEHFIGDIMTQQSDPKVMGKVVFVATKAGKGKLQIIPDTDDVERAVDLWVTVQ